ncbi:MAG TPA: hypothetical protein DEF07_05130 [Nitrosomonas sp.]|nr:hypothetical protein [Nitrosomonas sp.]
MQTEQFKKNPVDFVAEQGGSYAFVLGIDLNGLKSVEIYKWFLAALLYGARISEKIATHTWQAFKKTSCHVSQASNQRRVGWVGCIAG